MFHARLIVNDHIGICLGKLISIFSDDVIGSAVAAGPSGLPITIRSIPLDSITDWWTW